MSLEEFKIKYTEIFNKIKTEVIDKITYYEDFFPEHDKDKIGVHFPDQRGYKTYYKRDIAVGGMILDDYERRKKSDDEFIEYLYEYYRTGDKTLIPKIYPIVIKPDNKHHLCKCLKFWPLF